ncbi:MAG: YidH family protein [Pirellulaceae bacterium]
MPTEPIPDPRVPLAAERTLLAWVRTALAMMGFGFVVARFGLFLREMAATSGGAPQPPHLGLSLWMGTGLVVLGAVTAVLAAARHLRFIEQLQRGESYVPSRWSMGVIVAGVIALIGVLMTGYLLLMNHS